MNGTARDFGWVDGADANNPRFCTGQHWLPGGQTRRARGSESIQVPRSGTSWPKAVYPNKTLAVPFMAWFPHSMS